MKKFLSWLFGGLAIVATLGLALAQQPGVNSTLNTVFNIVWEQSTTKPTYSYSTFNSSVPAQPSNVCALFGSATKTLRVRRILVGGNATAVFTDPITIEKRTGAYVGNGFTPPMVPYDSTFAAATGLGEVWFTTNPTSSGTIVGAIAEVSYTWPNATTGIGTGQMVFRAGELAGPIYLRGTTQSVAINLNGVTNSGMSLYCTFEWTEDSDT